MINTNIPLKSNRNYPFKLAPVGKDYLWGGTRLNDDFAKGIDLLPLAETWECSTHPNGLSTVCSGFFKGKTLKAVLEGHPEYLGKHSEGERDFPLIIKLIDAKADLSVQVHPDDEYAIMNENGQMGKTEFWYILDATKDAQIVYGFHHDCSKESVRKSINDGSLEKLLQKIPVHKDDVFQIDAGIVHAIGSGTLVAEIQQRSDLTYRLYDYNRSDDKGCKRELHIKKGLDVAKLCAIPEPTQPMRVLKYSPGCAVELLERCKYFQVERMLINTERIRDMVHLHTDDLSFKVLLCTTGCGILRFETNYLPVFKGDCFFVPADSVDVQIHGKMQLLCISC